MIVGKMPDQVKLPFSLWTRAAVASLIAREYGIGVSLVTVGRYLHAWGMSPQRPVRRAYERNEAAIARWLRREYPAIARQAKREQAVIYWGDEMGLRSDHVTGTSYAPKGHTPVVRATGRRFGCNMISAITNKGALAFMVFQGTFKAPVFGEFMKRLLKQLDGKIYLIVDGHPVHRSNAATRFVAQHPQRLRLIRMPGYCPELNPDELLNQDVKTNGLGKSRPTNRTELLATVRRHLHRRQKQPQVISNLFREKHVRYAA
jgi:transposase